MFFLAPDIQKKTGVDLLNIDTSNAVRKIKEIPAYFMVSELDYITPVEEIQKLFKGYGCDYKKMVKLQGYHHTFRQNEEILQAADFLKKIADKKLYDTKKVNMRRKKSLSKLISVTMTDHELEIPDENIYVPKPKVSLSFHRINSMHTIVDKNHTLNENDLEER
jgi:hypothetical protein